MSYNQRIAREDRYPIRVPVTVVLPRMPPVGIDGITVDVSTSGVLIEMQPIGAGQIIVIAFAGLSHKPIFVLSRVVRAGPPIDGRSTVGASFEVRKDSDPIVQLIALIKGRLAQARHNGSFRAP